MVVWPKVVSFLLLPPSFIIILSVIGLVVLVWWRTIGMAILGFCILMLFVLSIPIVGKSFITPLESDIAPIHPDRADTVPKDAQAIVVIGGGRYAAAPEYGTDIVNHNTLSRLAYAARLHRSTKLPILLSGGKPFDHAVPEADLMQNALQANFGIKAKWLETESRNTMENALLSAEILSKADIKKVILVTQAWHMRRAFWAFRRAGLAPIAAPIDFTTLDNADRQLVGYFPSPRGMGLTRLALKERMALTWYESKYDSDFLEAYARERTRKAKTEAEHTPVAKPVVKTPTTPRKPDAPQLPQQRPKAKPAPQPAPN